MADNKYVVGYAKLGTSSCKKCKEKIEKGGLRIGKVTPNPFADDGSDMKQWFHPKCIFETFVRARATTKKIEDPDDAEGFHDLKQEDQDVIQKLIDGDFSLIFSNFLLFHSVFRQKLHMSVPRSLDHLPALTVITEHSLAFGMNGT